MPKVKPVVLKKKIAADGTTNIKIRLTHQGKCREIATPYYIEPEFMGRDGQIKPAYSGYTTLNNALMKIVIEYNQIIQDIGPAISHMPVKDLLNKLRKNEQDGASFTKYLNGRIETLKDEGRLSYAESYTVTGKLLQLFTNKETLFKDISKEFLTRFDSWLVVNRGAKTNTRRIYLNNIRAVFNHAIDNEVIKQELFPFRKFKIIQEQPEKRTLEINEIRRLKFGPYPPGQKTAVDIWFLIFYLAGINYRDLLYLKEIRGGRVEFKREKTKRKVKFKLSVRVVPEVMEIINRYRGEKYLLNFLDADDSYKHFKSVCNNLNHRLRLVAKRIGLPEHLSSYYARHSFASIAYNHCGVSIDHIGQALGHTNKTSKITEVYIKKDYNIIDAVQRKVINKVSCNQYAPCRSRKRHS